MAKQQHGTVKVQRPGDEKPRTIPATLWNSEHNPFKKQGYKIVTTAAEPVGVRPKPAKAAKLEQPEPVQSDAND